MASSSGQILMESPPGSEIDLEDLTQRTSSSAGVRRRPSHHQSHRRLAMWMAERLRIDSWRDKNSDKILVNLSGHDSLKKNYRKIAHRPNLRLADRVFMYTKTDTDQLDIAKHETWSSCFERILPSEDTNGTAFEVCVVSIDTTNLGRAFSFIDKTFLVSYDRRQQAYSSLKEIVIRLFQRQWKLSDEIMVKIMESLHAKPLSLSPWRPKLPSNEGRAPIEIAHPVPLKFEFKWIHAPHYATDLSVYVFRPYGKHPQVESLDVILTSYQYEQMRRAIVVVNSHHTLAKLRSGRFSAQVLEENVFSLSYTLHLFQAVCSEVTAGLVAFTERACEEINYMVYEGRLRPSGSKMQYLHHLEDCHLVAKNCCKTNRQTLQLLLDQINSIHGPRADEEAKQISHLELAMKDLEYLHGEVESSLLRISDIRVNLRESLELLQIRRTSVLGILAALYLPLSFVTLLGNESQPIHTPVQASWHNTTVYAADGSNSTTPMRIKDAGANQAWSLPTFFEIAVPLIVGSILVPLVIGSIIRVILQAFAQGRTWWRLFFALIVIGYAFVAPLIWYMLAPFWAFTLLQLAAIIWSDKKSWLRVVYWLSSTMFSVASTLLGFFIYLDWGILCLINGLYGISLFVFWWWRPDFYYRWDQGRRPKSKED